MARINIEDKLWSDDRFLSLLEKLGSRAQAVGSVVLAFKLAQEFWLPNKKNIPLPRWELSSNAQALLDSGLAVLQQDGVYVSGTEENFAWYFAKVVAGKAGGKASAAARETKGKKSKQRSSTAQADSSESNPLTLTLTLPPTLTLPADSFSKREKSPSANAGAFIATYCRVWKERYQARPEITGKEQGIAKRLSGSIGTERASELVESFLRMNDSWFLQKRHDLATFEQNLNAVVQFHETGNTVSRTQIQQADKLSHAQDQLKRIAEGKL